MKPTLFATIMDFFNSNQPVVLQPTAEASIGELPSVLLQAWLTRSSSSSSSSGGSQPGLRDRGHDQGAAG